MSPTSSKPAGKLFAHLDVSSESDWATAMARVVDEFGGLDILVNNAGTGPLCQRGATRSTAVYGVAQRPRSPVRSAIRVASGQVNVGHPLRPGRAPKQSVCASQEREGRVSG